MEIPEKESELATRFVELHQRIDELRDDIRELEDEKTSVLHAWQKVREASLPSGAEMMGLLKEGKTKKYWVITRQSHEEGGGFSAYPAEEDNLKRIIEIATTDREGENYVRWVAEEIEFHKETK